jgi:hypothetical protein
MKLVYLWRNESISRFYWRSQPSTTTSTSNPPSPPPLPRTTAPLSLNFLSLSPPPRPASLPALSLSLSHTHTLSLPHFPPPSFSPPLPLAACIHVPWTCACVSHTHNIHIPVNGMPAREPTPSWPSEFDPHANTLPNRNPKGKGGEVSHTLLGTHNIRHATSYWQFRGCSRKSSLFYTS